MREILSNVSEGVRERLERLRRTIEAAAPTHHQEQAQEAQQPDPQWGPRQPVPPAWTPVPELGPEHVPIPLREWVVGIATWSSLPLEMVAIPCVVVLGALVGRGVGVRPEPASTWTVVPNVWGAIVAPPGMLKTHVLTQVVEPVRRMEAEAHDHAAHARIAAQAKRLTLEAQLHRLKRSAASEDAVRALLAEMDACTVRARRYLTHDATVEKLGELLAENPRGLLMVRDELAGWLASFDRPGREGERAFFLEAWNGTGSYTVDRIGRGTIHIPALCVSVLGTIQPGRLAHYIAAAIAGGTGADGLLQRFQLVVWPDRMPPYRQGTTAPDPQVRARVERLYRRLAQLDATQWTGCLVGAGGIPCLPFDMRAQELFNEWRTALENRVRGSDLAATPAYCAHVAKYRSLMPALAVIMHLVEWAETAAPSPGPITLTAARTAAIWVDYLDCHARKMYAPELKDALLPVRALASHIEAGDVKHGDLVRDIYRRGWSQLETPERVWAALRTLETLNWVRIVTVRTRGRAQERIELTPELRGGGPKSN